MAKVIEIDLARGWFYESCTHCFKKVQDIGGKWFCEGKNCMRIVIPVRRYMINLNVIDASGSTNFVMFDRVVVKHFGKSVTDFTKLNQVGLDDELPHDIDLLVDKFFLFKVEGGGGNNKFKHTFNIKAMTDEVEVIEKFQKMHGIQDFIEYDNERDSEFADNNTENCSYVNVLDKCEEFVKADDNLKDLSQISVGETPTRKEVGKRLRENVEVISIVEDVGTQSSSSKLPKLADFQ
ncbi:hypothetical protein SESBI_48932 [Sesbania bispinosa]|nr:hypothetical protein SESBI_48932 [Sesbania bispinosa]